MIGPDAVKAQLVAWWSVAVPEQLAALRLEHGWSTADVPDLGGIVVGEPHRTPVRHPVLFAGLRGMTAARHDVDDDSYVMRYTMRGYVFARGKQYADTERQRDALLLSLRQAVLLDTGAARPTGWHVDPGTVREEYADVGVDEGGYGILAGYLEAAITVRELLDRATLGTVETTATDTYPLPPHPALED